MSPSETEIISVRLRKGTRKRLKDLGIDTATELRNHLEDLAWKRDVAKTLDELTVLIKEKSKPSKPGFSVRSIREDRDEGH